MDKTGDHTDRKDWNTTYRKQKTAEKGLIQALIGENGLPRLMMPCPTYAVYVSKKTAKEVRPNQKPMAFPTPSESDVSTDSETSDSEDKTFDGRNEDMEDYKAVIDSESAIQALCMTHGVGVDDGFARYNDVKDDSPLAEMGLFYYKKKQEMKTELRDSRESEDGELSEDQNLPAYMDQFETPEYEYDEITAENAGDFGIDSEHISDDRTLYVPTELELPTDEDGNLKLWNDEDDSEADYTKEDVLEALESTDQIGQTTAGRALNRLQEAGIISEDI